jgi:hypothetical protein
MTFLFVSLIFYLQTLTLKFDFFNIAYMLMVSDRVIICCLYVCSLWQDFYIDTLGQSFVLFHYYYYFLFNG